MAHLLSPGSPKRKLKFSDTIEKQDNSRARTGEYDTGKALWKDNSAPLVPIVYFDTADKWKVSEDGKKYIRTESPVDPSAPRLCVSVYNPKMSVGVQTNKQTGTHTGYPIMRKISFGTKKGE